MTLRLSGLTNVQVVWARAEEAGQKPELREAGLKLPSNYLLVTECLTLIKHNPSFSPLVMINSTYIFYVRRRIPEI